MIFALKQLPARESGIVLDRERGTPVASATVFMQRSVGSVLHRVKEHSSLRTGADGRYTFPSQRGRFEFVVALAPGYLPEFPDARGYVRLTPLPQRAFPLRKGRIRVASGTANGFSFALGRHSVGEEADIVAVAHLDGDIRISLLWAEGDSWL